MNQGTYPLAASMINQLNRLDQISNNLANSNTNGFKQESTSEKSFNYYLDKIQNNNEQPLKESVVNNTIPKMGNKFIIEDKGSIIETGNNLDFSLVDNNAFFKINSNNEILYTKDGSFKNLEGYLVNSNGNYVLDNDNNPIRIEEGWESNIGIVILDYNNIEKVGNNNYKANNIEEVINLNDNEGKLNQGTIETSNVNSVSSMVQLIDAHRRFEQSQKALSSIDEINSKLIDKIGNPR